MTLAPWNMCSMTVKGEPCKNKARHPGGSKCSTCFNRATEAKKPGYHKEYCKQYYDKNRQACLEKQRRYYQRNKESGKIRAWIYRQTNQDKLREYDQNVRKPRRKAREAALRALLAQESSQAPASEPTDQSRGLQDDSKC